MSFPESLRDRAEAVMDDVGVVFSGDLVSDVKAAADALGVSYTTMGETVEACEEALFEKDRIWVEEGLKKQREERIRKRPKKEAKARAPNPWHRGMFGGADASDEDINEDASAPLSFLAGPVLKMEPAPRKRLKKVRCRGLFDKDASVEDSPVDIINAAPVPLRRFISARERDARRGGPPRAAKTRAPDPNTVAARVRKRRRS